MPHRTYASLEGLLEHWGRTTATEEQFSQDCLNAESPAAQVALLAACVRQLRRIGDLLDPVEQKKAAEWEAKQAAWDVELAEWRTRRVPVGAWAQALPGGSPGYGAVLSALEMWATVKTYQEPPGVWRVPDGLRPPETLRDQRGIGQIREAEYQEWLAGYKAARKL